MRFFPKNVFYGWRIVAAGAMINALIAAFLNQSFGSYVAVLTEEKGWSKTALSGAAAVRPVRVGIIGKRLLPYRLFEAAAKDSLGV